MLAHNPTSAVDEVRFCLEWLDRHRDHWDFAVASVASALCVDIVRSAAAHGVRLPNSEPFLFWREVANPELRFTAREAAAVLGVTDHHVRRLGEGGRLAGARKSRATGLWTFCAAEVAVAKDLHLFGRH